MSLNNLDFSNGIFGSAPRKSMLSLSTDLGYDSQNDHGLTDDLASKNVLLSGSGSRDRRNSITCGTNALRLRRSISTDVDSRTTTQNEAHFKEYKV